LDVDKEFSRLSITPKALDLLPAFVHRKSQGVAQAKSFQQFVVCELPKNVNAKKILN
jgi:hypothetical protein